MTTLLTRLTLCFALFYSVNSAAYNEAMCILIKQEVQQYSNNKTSEKYRKAARDYKKHCNKPKQVLTQSKPVVKEPEPSVIVTQPQPNNVQPAPVIEPTNQTTDGLIDEKTLNLTDEQKQQISDMIDANASEVTINVEPTQPTPTEKNEPNNTADNQTLAEPITTQKREQAPAQVLEEESKKVQEPAQSQVTQQATPVKQPTEPTVAPVIKPAPMIAPQPAREQPSSLLLPSFVLVLVVLIGAMVIIRLRRAKQTNASAAVTAVSTQTQNTQSAEKQTANVTSEQQQPKTTHKTPAPSEQSATEAAEQKAPTNDAVTNDKPREEKPQPNTAEFEAAAKTTLERIKNASSFNEPQVRDFDPDAKPVKKQRKHSPVKPEPTPAEPVEKTEQPAEQTPEPLPKSTPTKLDKPEPEAPAFKTEHDFKEPEVRTFDPNAPLPGKKKKTRKTEPTQTVAEPPAPQNTPETIQPEPEASETKAEPKTPAAEPKKADTNNPFANLSLDASWDPNSAEKPKIEEKQRAPKSQALIDAEERAKKLQTKE
ncbi:cell surface protein [Pseudoalteromonas marina]|uniref:Cell surface protein n=1 Tax=Pseudoalteromonas marina TaxID=267375 RepID=A0ABT9FB40_9GAMM|nr:cell surface protein [Pseudoalteromonas marina]MDP2563894.1 cell surface protein [Pseudoalteromonas marina]